MRLNKKYYVGNFLDILKKKKSCKYKIKVRCIRLKF